MLGLHDIFLGPRLDLAIYVWPFSKQRSSSKDSDKGSSKALDRAIPRKDEGAAFEDDDHDEEASLAAAALLVSGMEAAGTDALPFSSTVLKV